MDTQKETTATEQFIHELSSSLDEANWFLKQRLRAYSHLEHLEDPQIERLDYSAWDLFKKSDIAMNQKKMKEKSVAEKDINANYLQRSSETSQKRTQEKNHILVIGYSELFNKENEKFRKYYEDSEFVDFKDTFNAFNLAFLTSGIFIYVPKETEVKEPLEIDFLVNQKGGRNKNHQVFIYAEENSSVEILESYYSTENKDSSKLNVHVHIQANTGATVKYTAIDELATASKAFFRRTAKAGRDAMIEIALGVMNEGHAIEDIKVDLFGDGSSADVKSVAISRSAQVQCVNAQVNNHGSHTVGNIYQHGVVLDQATLTFNGIGDVFDQAKHSDAQQESRILMLSDEARADTNPLLLIDEYELTAGHAASISRVDEAQLYYLMSRGLLKKQAEKLVIRGFLGSVLSAISVKEVRERFIETIERKLSVL